MQVIADLDVHSKYARAVSPHMTPENISTWTDIESQHHRGVPEYLQTEETPIDSNWTDIPRIKFLYICD